MSNDQKPEWDARNSGARDHSRTSGAVRFATLPDAGVQKRASNSSRQSHSAPSDLWLASKGRKGLRSQSELSLRTVLKSKNGVELPSIVKPANVDFTRTEPKFLRDELRTKATKRSWSTEPKPAWVTIASDEMQDIIKLEQKYQDLHSKQSMALQQRYHNCVQEHRSMTLRQTQMSPLVVCVLDKFASGGGLLHTYAGQDVSFALQVKYSLAAHLGEGGEDLRRWIDSCGGFSCVLNGPVAISADVVYQGAGTFVFRYKPVISGKYLVSVRLGNGDVPGSPFESIVEAGKTHTQSCTVSGLGLLCAEAGVQAEFTIFSRDEFGNLKESGGDRYDVGLTGPICFNANVTDVNNGTYSVKYNTIMCGDYYVNIRRDGVPLSGSPFVLSVVAGKTHGPSCTAIGDGLKTSFAGQDAEFVIQARDIIGNARVVGDDAFVVEIEGPSTPQISVFDRDDGTYLVTYVVAQTGTYFVRVSISGLPIVGSPFMANILPGRAVAVRCTAIGRGLTRAYAGEDAKFTVESRDLNRNKTTSGIKAFLVTVRGVISPEVHSIPGDDGEFHYSYRTARAGVYFVGILFDGVDIGGSPFKLTVDPGPTHANGCSASGPGITGGYTGMETSFVIQARDYYGNNRNSGGDIFNIDIGGTASARMRIRDNDNGTYTVAYTPEMGGDYYISVKYNGIDIQGSPFTVSSDPMPRENYLEMYRSMEPEFGRMLQSQMLGSSDNSLAQKREEQKAAAKKKKAQNWELNIKLLSGSNLVAKDTRAEGTYGTTFSHSSDPYVVFRIGGNTVRSKTVDKNLNPQWNEELVLTVTNRLEKLELEVMDEDENDEDDSMGTSSVSILDLVEGKPKMMTVKLQELDTTGKDTGNGMGTVQVVLTINASKDASVARQLR